MGDHVSPMVGEHGVHASHAPKFLAPVSLFSTFTAGPSLAFIVRLKGEMSDADFAGLSARVVSGTNSYNLSDQGSERNWGRHSLIKCWRLESTPASNAPVERRVSFASGAELARIGLPANQAEFARPLIAPAGRKHYIAGILRRFLDGKASTEGTLKAPHDLYEEYGVPEYLTPFEMIYYDHCAPGAEKGRENPTGHLQAEARDWLRETKLE